jgi:hypothetical protein
MRRPGCVMPLVGAFGGVRPMMTATSVAGMSMNELTHSFIFIHFYSGKMNEFGHFTSFTE